jgi:hypothetical protein
MPPLSDVADVKLQAATVPVIATAAAGSGMTHSYLLNAADDRLKEAITSTGTNTYSYLAGHRISGIDTHTVTHYLDGHRATDNRFRYDTDGLGRVVRILDAVTSLKLAEFHYDALGRVSSGMSEGEMFERSFRGANWIHEKRGPKDAVRQLTTHPLSGVPLCVTKLSVNSFLHEDGGWSTLCATNARDSLNK